MGWIKVAGRKVIVISPHCETIIEGRSGVPPKTTCQVLVEASQDASLPRGLLVANALAHLVGVSVRLLSPKIKSGKAK